MLAIAKRTLTALTVIGILLTVGVSSASAMLSFVGPRLSSNPAQAKVQVETMLHHDLGVQKFYARELHVNVWEVRKAKVLELNFGYCVIGTKKCPFNTGKNSAGEVVKTNFRLGERRKVAYVKVAIGKQEYWVTLEAPCVNLLSGGKPLRPQKPPVPVSPKKPIVFKLVSTSYSISTSTSSAKAECPSGTVESQAGAGANAGAEAKATFKVYRQGRHSWVSLFAQINSISTTTYTSTSTGTSVTCTPKGSPPEEAEAPKIKNVYKIQEVRTKEEIQFYADLYAPVGDEVVLTFETEFGKFTPEKFVVPSYGAQSHFVTTYKAPSEALMDPVCVTALDKTTGKEAEPQCQLVEVQATPEPPS